MIYNLKSSSEAFVFFLFWSCNSFNAHHPQVLSCENNDTSAIYRRWRVSVSTAFCVQVYLHEQSCYLIGAHTVISFVCISDDYRLDIAKTIVRLPPEYFPFHSLVYDVKKRIWP